MANLERNMDMSTNALCLPVILAAIVAGGQVASAEQRKPGDPTHTDVPYGPHERNLLDLWEAEGDGPRPLLVFIHGGGWTRGSKTRSSGQVRPFLERGISYASIHYRLSSDAPLPAPVHDAARAIQFIRHKAEEWNIDKNRIALTGGSAGACTSMYILLRDDLADPEAEDPVLRESTRVTAAAAVNGQTSIDPKVIEGWLGPNVLRHRMIWLSVGAKSMAEAFENYEQYKPLYVEFSPYNHLTADDPPLMMTYNRPMTLPSLDAGHGIHHPVYGVKLKEKSDEIGHECHLLVDEGPRLSDYENVNDFLMSKLLLESP